MHGMTTRMLMTNGRNDALYRLMTWLSPTYPVGAYSYSHGLEWAVQAGDVTNADSLLEWLSDVVRYGTGRTDAILFTHAWRAVTAGDAAALHTAAEFGVAAATSKERHVETTAQGKAFVSATRAAWPCDALGMLDESCDGEVAYPVAVACASAGHFVPIESALTAYLHAWAANLVSAGLRLVPLGQSDGQRIIVRLEAVVSATMGAALDASLDDIGSAAVLADIAAMQHETQHTRLFRT